MIGGRDKHDERTRIFLLYNAHDMGVSGNLALHSLKNIRPNGSNHSEIFLDDDYDYEPLEFDSKHVVYELKIGGRTIYSVGPLTYNIAKRYKNPWALKFMHDRSETLILTIEGDMKTGRIVEVKADGFVYDPTEIVQPDKKKIWTDPDELKCWFRSPQYGTDKPIRLDALDF